MNGLRVIIAGGGTGGHIFPAVAIGHALQRLRPDTQLLFVGANGKMEMEKVPKEGFEIKGLDIAGFNRSSIWKNLSLPFKLIKSRMQAKAIIEQFKPGVVVGVGGYASFPILQAAQSMRIPTLIQEQNSFAGKSNKILGKRAAAICVAYGGMEQFFPADRIMLTGNPVRKSISGMSGVAADGRARFGLKEGLKTVLVIGGSLGAKSINETIDEQLGTIVRDDTQVLWQTGKPYHALAVKRAEGFANKVKVLEFISEMDLAYAAADVVISRAGALAVAELCIAAKPVIFVPYPFAAENHQESNAKALVTQKAALMVRDGNLKTELVSKLKELLGDLKLQASMSQVLRGLAVKDADERIANRIFELAGT
jgi:UDP-N-acetylglucosamine--N-acetylmuramyl-(pentapeptide) pyrophosphoryl-undecaprenol N-acetylglucosamine transferase